MKPKQGPSGAAQFLNFVEDQRNGLLDTPVRILLVPVARLHETDWRRDDKLAPPGLLVTGRQRALAQQVELILVEAALQAEQQPVIALTRRVRSVMLVPSFACVLL